MVASIPTILFALASTALGHGYLNVPLPTFLPGVGDITAFCGTMDGPTVLPGDQYNTSPDANTAAFTKQFKASSYKTLKDLVTANPGGCAACGHTDPNGTPMELPSDGNIYWHHGQEGFTPSHEGPCEVWCDNTRVYQNEDCARNIPNGTIPIDLATCQKSNLLAVYWMALHTPTWQTYINCARIKGGAAPSPSSATPTVVPTTKPSSNPTTAPTTKPSSYPTTAPTTKPSSNPTFAPSKSPSTSSAPTKRPVTPRPSSSSPYTPPPATPSPPSNGQVQGYYQCGGRNYNGPTQCASGFNCKNWNEWYSQCVPN